MALPADRVRLRARARRTPAPERVLHRTRLPRRVQGRGGQLRRPGPTAHAHLAGPEDLAVAQLLRGRRVPRRHRPGDGPRGVGRGARARGPRARAARAGFVRGRLLPPAFPGRRGRGRARRAQRGPRCPLRGDRPRPRLVDAAPRDLRRAHVRHEPHEWTRRRRERRALVREPARARHGRARAAGSGPSRAAGPHPSRR